MKLKNFIFIDNDDASDTIVDQSLAIAKTFIESCGVPDFSWDDHQKELGWWRSDRNKHIDILLGTPQEPKDDILVTWSMYTVGQMANSRQQIINMLGLFGSNYINDRVYLDTSGLVGNLIDTILSESMEKNQAAIIRAIENNWIISKNKEGKPVILSVNTQVRSSSDSWVKESKFDLNHLFYK